MTEQDFVVKDRRRFSEDGEPRSEEAQEQNQEAPNQTTTEPFKEAEGNTPPNPKEGIPLPTVTFSAFVFSIGTSALIALGELPEPSTKQTIKNLPLAKQTIDVLGMLQEKTRGNLDGEEDNLLKNLLYELRMKYVGAVR